MWAPAHLIGLKQESWEGQEDPAEGGLVIPKSWEVGEIPRKGEHLSLQLLTNQSGGILKFCPGSALSMRCISASSLVTQKLLNVTKDPLAQNRAPGSLLVYFPHQCPHLQSQSPNLVPYLEARGGLLIASPLLQCKHEQLPLPARASTLALSRLCSLIFVTLPRT